MLFLFVPATPQCLFLNVVFVAGSSLPRFREHKRPNQAANRCHTVSGLLCCLAPQFVRPLPLPLEGRAVWLFSRPDFPVTALGSLVVRVTVWFVHSFNAILHLTGYQFVTPVTRHGYTSLMNAGDMSLLNAARLLAVHFFHVPLQNRWKASRRAATGCDFGRW